MVILNDVTRADVHATATRVGITFEPDGSRAGPGS